MVPTAIYVGYMSYIYHIYKLHTAYTICRLKSMDFLVDFLNGKFSLEVICYCDHFQH